MENFFLAAVQLTGVTLLIASGFFLWTFLVGWIHSAVFRRLDGKRNLKKLMEGQEVIIEPEFVGERFSDNAWRAGQSAVYLFFFLVYLRKGRIPWPFAIETAVLGTTFIMTLICFGHWKFCKTLKSLNIVRSGREFLIAWGLAFLISVVVLVFACWR